MKPNLRLHVGQQMSLSPQLVQSIRLLQLSSQELEQEVALALESNPLIEAETPETPDDRLNCASVVGEAVAQAADAPLDSTPIATSTATGTDVDVDDSFAAADAWTAAERENDGDDENGPYRRAAAAEPGLRARIEAELALEIETEGQARAVVAVLEAVDDAGYLAGSVASLAATAGLPEQLFAAALAMIKRVAPTGFAATNLRECLLEQLEEVRAGTPGKNLAEQLVMDHLPALAARNLEPLRTSLAATPEKFRTALALIRSLNPKPGAEASEDITRYVVPDIIISGSNGAWKVELNPAVLPRVRLNGLYEKVLANSSHARGLKEKLNEARWLVRGLEMRHETLLKTAKVIFQRQCAFLTTGEVAMRPLTLREVAQAIEMHESTVSRVTTAKFALTPWGVFELKHFFSVSLAGGEAEASGVAVRAMIRQLVDAENEAKPLCDGAISAILGRKGVQVARRTVAKYREAMKIAPAPERKVLPSVKFQAAIA